jgi:hypothetical protein
MNHWLFDNVMKSNITLVSVREQTNELFDSKIIYRQVTTVNNSENTKLIAGYVKERFRARSIHHTSL